MTVRPARYADLDTLATLDLTLPDHQARSPVFSVYRSPARPDDAAFIGFTPTFFRLHRLVGY